MVNKALYAIIALLLSIVILGLSFVIIEIKRMNNKQEEISDKVSEIYSIFQGYEIKDIYIETPK